MKPEMLRPGNDSLRSNKHDSYPVEFEDRREPFPGETNYGGSYLIGFREEPHTPLTLLVRVENETPTIDNVLDLAEEYASRSAESICIHNGHRKFYRVEDAKDELHVVREGWKEVNDRAKKEFLWFSYPGWGWRRFEVKQPSFTED